MATIYSRDIKFINKMFEVSSGDIYYYYYYSSDVVLICPTSLQVDHDAVYLLKRSLELSHTCKRFKINSIHGVDFIMRESLEY